MEMSVPANRGWSQLNTAGSMKLSKPLSTVFSAYSCLDIIRCDFIPGELPFLKDHSTRLQRVEPAEL